MCTATISIMQSEMKNVRMTSNEEPRLAVIVCLPQASPSCPGTYPTAKPENGTPRFRIRTSPAPWAVA